MVAVAAAIVLIPGAPLGLITTAVQALAGLLLPSASVFLLLLCNDPEVLGPWVNRPWLNALAGLIVGVLLLLSGILMATTLFPHLDVVAVGGYLAVAMVVLAAAATVTLRWLSRRRPQTGRPRTRRTRDRRGRPQHLADATVDAVAARHMVNRHPTRHARPTRLPRHRRRAAHRQSHPTRPRIAPPTAQIRCAPAGRPPTVIVVATMRPPRRPTQSGTVPA